MEIPQNLRSPALVTAETRPQMDKNVLGMIVFIASESVFFLLLILTYIYFGTKVISGPNAKDNLELVRTAIFTVFLLSSSLTIWLAERSLHKGSRRGMIGWLLVTILFGAIFLVGQVTEYATLINERGVTVSTNLFGTTFFTLTGFHGLHVFIGLIALSIIALYAITGSFKGHRSSALTTVSLYWHFVDVVWIVVFTVVYVFSAS